MNEIEHIKQKNRNDLRYKTSNKTILTRYSKEQQKTILHFHEKFKSIWSLTEIIDVLKECCLEIKQFSECLTHMNNNYECNYYNYCIHKNRCKIKFY